MIVENYLEYINKKFKVSFTEECTPPIRCPHCLSGDILLDRKTFVFDETPSSKALHVDPDFEPDWIEYRYSGCFICNKCNGRTYSCGVGNQQYNHCYDGKGNFELEDYALFHPKYFEPQIPLFLIHHNCPKAVTETLFQSFRLAWIDASSAANKLRIAIEKLLEFIDPELSKLPNLNERLKVFSKSEPEVSNLLMAIKWLGNNASHESCLEEHDLAFAYEVMELSISKLFDDSEDRIKQLVSLVNMTKGKPFK